jgi:hypothetical protein
MVSSMQEVNFRKLNNLRRSQDNVHRAAESLVVMLQKRPGGAYLSRMSGLHTAALLSLAAALIHLWAAPEHFREWWGYGVFFLSAASAQAIFCMS